MKFFSSEIVADARNIDLEIFRTKEERRNYLVGWFNEHVVSGALGPDVDPLRPRSSAEQAAAEIEEVIGRPVILGEVFV